MIRPGKVGRDEVSNERDARQHVSRSATSACRAEAELAEARDQQAATAEVLQVINSSPGDLTPVFNAMLERAMRLCVAKFGVMTTFDGSRFQTVAWHGVPSALADLLAKAPPDPGPYSAPTRMARGGSAHGTPRQLQDACHERCF